MMHAVLQQGFPAWIPCVPTSGIDRQLRASSGLGTRACSKSPACARRTNPGAQPALLPSRRAGMHQNDTVRRGGASTYGEPQDEYSCRTNRDPAHFRTRARHDRFSRCFGLQPARRVCIVGDPRMATTIYNLLAFSDVHLGSDLVQHARPEAPRSPAASVRRDRDLAALLDWYREHRVGGHPWRLIIGGDFIDFTGMSVMFERGDSQMLTRLTREEASHGLGGASDHTLAKLRLVMNHHAPVMHALA